MFQTADMLRIFNAHRGDAIVVPGRGGPALDADQHAPTRDVPVGDPAMGGHAGFALGLALARPAERVVLFDSEGDLLMSLGILPTVAELAPANFYHFMLDNECYATTGGQPVPNAKNVAYDVIARGCGLSARVRLRQARGLRGEPAVHPGPAGPGVRGAQGGAGGRERPDRAAGALADPHPRPRAGGPARGAGRRAVAPP